MLKKKMIQVVFCDFCDFLWLRKAVGIAWLLCAGFCGAEPVGIDFFFEPGCHECERIEAEVFPELGRRFAERVVVQRHDIGIETNFIYLLQLEDALGYAGDERAYLMVEKQHVFGSRPDVEALCSVISNLLFDVGQASCLSVPDRPVPEKQAGSLSYFRETDSDPIRNRFSGFTLPAVLVAGLLDGLNPCAISTLVFFMSLLAVSKVRKRPLLVLGFSFCLASFLTYLALGFGLFRVLHLFSGFTVLRSVVEWGMSGILLVLAVLSFRDAVRFRKSEDGHDVTLQLSKGMKVRIHGVMRRGLGFRRIFLGGLVIGTAVTALESVCTGQVYVPTLVLILKNSSLSEGRAWVFLLGYNLMFIVPLVFTFGAVYWGLRAETLLRWSRKNVVFGKCLLGVFFILMIFLIHGAMFFDSFN